MNTIVSLLQQGALFREVEEPLLHKLAEHTRRRTFAANEALFHEGDPGYTFYLIVSGHVKIQTTLPTGATIHLATRGPGEHFGEMALIDGKPRMADAITMEPCDLLILERSDFIACVETSPRIALGIMASLADRLRESADRLQARQGLDVLGRLAQTLLELMQAHGSPHASGGTLIAARVSQQDLAEQIGTTRESVTRALTRLKETGAIRADGRSLIVLHPNKLLKLCQK